MQVTVFNGSPAGKNSATNVIGEAFLRGAARAGAETRNIFLMDHEIEQCRGCFACWFKTPGQCALKDDMAALLALYSRSDIVCFATPVYTWNMTGLMKNFADRLVPLKSPMLTETQGKYDLEDAIPKTQQFVVLANCGFPGEHNFEVLKAAFACCNPGLEIYRNCGKLLKTGNVEAAGKVPQWLRAVEQAGWEMTKTGEVSAETRLALDKPLMSTAEYVAFLQT